MIPLAPIWLATKAFGGKVLAFVVSPVGRWVVGGLIVLCLWAWERDHHADAKVAQAQARHAKQLAEAAAEVRRLAGVRDVLARAISEDARKAAQEQQGKTQAATGKAVSVVTRYRDRLIPAHCPTTLPPEVEDEGRKAVARANQ